MGHQYNYYIDYVSLVGEYIPPPPVYTPTIPYYEPFEVDTGNWTYNSQVTISTATSNSSSHSVAIKGILPSLEKTPDIDMLSTTDYWYDVSVYINDTTHYADNLRLECFDSVFRLYFNGNTCELIILDNTYSYPANLVYAGYVTLPTATWTRISSSCYTGW